MASDDESQSVDHHHDDQEWEAHKENFRRCYMDNNMTRKGAAKYMKDVFGFDATPRQWERKIKQWGFQKYSSREERIKQIAQTGKTVYEVSKPGRRPRAHSSHSLHPHEDRNLRRFARREVSRSRSRSRSRSTSFTGPSRPQVSDDFSDIADHPGFDQSYNYSDSVLSNNPNVSGFNLGTSATDSRSEQHMHYPFLQEQKNSGFDGPADAGTLYPVDNAKWSQTHLPLVANQGHLQDYSSDMLSQSSMGRRTSNPNVSYVLGENEAHFPLGSESIIPPAQFNPFPASGNNIGINPNVLSNNLLSDPAIFDDGTQNTQVSSHMTEPDYSSSLFQFDVVDVDSGAAPLNMAEDDFHPIPPDAGGFANPNVPAFTINTAGPLQNDIGPLVEEYIRSVQTVAMLQAGSGIEKRLAAEAQFFTDRLAIILDNFMKSQQRAVLDVGRTCSKLRERNKQLESQLENMLGDSMQMHPDIAQDARSHHSSLPIQSSNYGNMYQDF